MAITIEVSDERIYNLLCSANYGAIDYWVDRMTVVPGTEPNPEGVDGPQGETEAAPLTGGRWEIKSEGKRAGRKRTDTLDRAACERGLAVMAAKYPQHFCDLLTENDDATTADVFVQCALFGEIVYG